MFDFRLTEKEQEELLRAFYESDMAKRYAEDD